MNTQTIGGCKLRATLVPEMKYGNQCRGVWRFFDVSDGTPRVVGAQYPTRECLLADMYRYLHDGWGYLQ